MVLTVNVPSISPAAKNSAARTRLRRFISDRGMIEPRRKTGTCAKHQRSVTVAIKRARYIALLPFTNSAPRG